MALKISFPSKFTKALLPDSYLIVEAGDSNTSKGGRLEIAAYVSEAARDAHAAKTANVPIPIGATETLDEDGCVTQLAWADVGGKGLAAQYAKIKTLKIRCMGFVVDMADAADC